MKVKIIPVFIAVAWLATALRSEPSMNSKENLMAKIDKIESIKSEKSTTKFRITLAVANISKKNALIRLMYCSISDNIVIRSNFKVFIEPESCDKNAPIEVLIKPNSAIRRTFIIAANRRIISDSATIKIGLRQCLNHAKIENNMLNIDGNSIGSDMRSTYIDMDTNNIIWTPMNMMNRLLMHNGSIHNK